MGILKTLLKQVTVWVTAGKHGAFTDVSLSWGDPTLLTGRYNPRTKKLTNERKNKLAIEWTNENEETNERTNHLTNYIISVTVADKEDCGHIFMFYWLIDWLVWRIKRIFWVICSKEALWGNLGKPRTYLSRSFWWNEILKPNGISVKRIQINFSETFPSSIRP